MNRQTKLTALAARAMQAPVLDVDGVRQATVFMSFTDGAARARTVTGVGADAAAAWCAAVAKLPETPGALAWLRVDWVTAVDPTDWARLKARLARTKRNYFRLGVSLDAGFRHAFLEGELNGNAMFYGGRDVPVAALNERNFLGFAKRRHALASVDFGDAAPVWTFATAGAFAGEDGMVHALEAQGRDGGRRVAAMDAGLVERVVADGARYLASQVGADGRFDYGWQPCFDRAVPGYNALRHASTVYAMLEAWEVTRDAALWEATARALDHLVTHLIHDGAEAAWLVDEGGEIKLGGNAVAVLALAKHAALTGSDAHDALMARLGDGMLRMQREDGGFVHVLQHPSLAVKQDFRIIYYDGEAAFALMRLYEASGDARWLAAVERAFACFARAGHAQAHDHWLGYAADALTRVRPEPDYFRFGVENVRGHLDFVAERITTFPTLLELMTAAERMVARMRDDAALRPLLAGLDLPKFYRAMHARAAYLLNGHFWPELAMFFAHPAKIAGSFFIRHHGFRVRIDDVEHYLSGLIAYRRYLIERGGEAAPDDGEGWTAEAVAAATGGRWAVPPGEGWRTGGMCIFPRSFRPGDLVLSRAGDGEPGMLPQHLARLPGLPAAIVTRVPAQVVAAGLPVLEVASGTDAVLAMGRHARSRFAGRVVGVTGSAGKTTMVAMLAHALSPWGAVAQTRHNANLPVGIAWNLASMPWDAPHVVLELAIGRMAQNARLARPDVAVFTNVLPAHLEYHRDLATVARRKSAIFTGMRPGGTAVLNADMAELSVVRDAAAAAEQKVLLYGRGAGAQYRLVEYCPRTGAVRATTPAGEIGYLVAARGEHMALNSLAVLATLDALGRTPARGAGTLATFQPLAGRGATEELLIGGHHVTAIDDAYNANPGSMAAALAALGGTPARRRVAVLGDMLELGPDALRYHADLAPLIARHGIDQVHVAGAGWADFWQALPPERRGLRAEGVAALRAALPAQFADGDVVLFKGSHGSEVHLLLDWLRTDAAAHHPIKELVV